MKPPFLWRQPWWTALPAALGMGGLWLIVVRTAGPRLASTSYLTSAALGIVATILVFAFLLRVSETSWRSRLFGELAILFVALAMTLAFVLVIRWLTPISFFSQDDGEDVIGVVFLGRSFSSLALFALALSAASHVAVRLFGHFYLFWWQLRRRRLLWEIAHVQIRLLMVIGVLLMALFSISFFLNWHRLGLDSSIRLVGALTNLTLVAGVLGILTGVAILILLLPSLLLSISTARRITRRLDVLVDATTALRRGNYELRVKVEGEDEIARLQANFNAMASTLEAALLDLQAERDAVAALLASRRQLFAGVSHDLRTPVTILRGLIESRQRTAQHNPDLAADLAMMEGEALRLQRLIDDIFALARTDATQVRFDAQPLDVIDVLGRIVAAAREQAWKGSRVDIVLDARPSLPLVLADETRLGQIMHNLLRNAVRHTLPGGLVMVVVAAEVRMVRIDVKDTGEGIAPEDLPRIWERFYRAGRTSTDEHQGAGLGLALVKEMTEAMGGAVAVESVVGQGSCFTIWLPAAAPAGTSPNPVAVTAPPDDPTAWR